MNAVTNPQEPTLGEAYGPESEQDDVLASLEEAEQGEQEVQPVIAPVTDDEVSEYRQINGGTKQEARRAVEKHHLHEALYSAQENGDLDDVIIVLHRVIERLN